MSATSTTSNFDLAIYKNTDTTSWNDFNSNMEKINTALQNATAPTITTEAAVDHVTLKLNGTANCMIDPAQGTNDGQVGRAGVMTSMQATQLATLAEAYKNATQGITLYEDTASTNYVSLSETANNYDHLVIVGEFMGTGSTAIKQTVSTEFHPTATARAFQLTAVDITTGNTPSKTTLQDIWSLTEDGLELELVMAQRAVESVAMNESVATAAPLEVTPDTTSIFTITKVVGYGKKA